MSKIAFKLIYSATAQKWFWTVFLPTQINRVSTRDEAFENMARTIRSLMKGDFQLTEIMIGHEVDNQTSIPGGWRHIIDWLNSRSPKPKKRKRKILVLNERERKYAPKSGRPTRLRTRKIQRKGSRRVRRVSRKRVRTAKASRR